MLGARMELGHSTGGWEGEGSKERRKERKGWGGGEQGPCPEETSHPRMAVCLLWAGGWLLPASY